jgi:hypothetical protein
VTRSRGHLIPAMFCSLLAGCSLTSGPDCIDETRSLAVSGKLASVAANPLPSDSGTASLNFHEARNYRTKAPSTREVMWFVSSSLDRASVTAIHVHEETTDRLLFTIPIDTLSGPRPVITQVFTRQPYTGTVDWTELYDLIGNARAYVDVHTSGNPGGHLRGELLLVYPNWQTFIHSYCS